MQLVINPGSSSKKYSLYEDGVVLLSTRFEKTSNGYEYTLTRGNTKEHKKVSESEYSESLAMVLTWCQESGLVEGAKQILEVGVRIVASGSFFTKHQKIDDEYVGQLKRAEPYAPLHISSTIKEIESAYTLLPETPLFGISDSEFHKTLPAEARTYAINPYDAETFDIWRFGYHGISVESVIKKAGKLFKNTQRSIVCHLGGGMSITAVLEGRSVETSMGFAPASGLPMSVRSGDIDAEALLYLMKRKDLSLEETQTYISTKGGYSALTEGITDMRDLLAQYEGNNEKAQLAIHVLQHRIKKYIGSYVAILGGLDLLILTATTNERNSMARKLFFGELEHLGIIIDGEKNTSLEENSDGLINSEKGIKIAVIHTDEMGTIAEITKALAESL